MPLSNWNPKAWKQQSNFGFRSKSSQVPKYATVASKLIQHKYILIITDEQPKEWGKWISHRTAKVPATGYSKDIHYSASPARQQPFGPDVSKCSKGLASIQVIKKKGTSLNSHTSMDPLNKFYLFVQQRFYLVAYISTPHNSVKPCIAQETTLSHDISYQSKLSFNQNLPSMMCQWIKMLMVRIKHTCQWWNQMAITGLRCLQKWKLNWKNKTLQKGKRDDSAYLWRIINNHYTG